MVHSVWILWLLLTGGVSVKNHARTKFSDLHRCLALHPQSGQQLVRQICRSSCARICNDKKLFDSYLAVSGFPFLTMKISSFSASSSTVSSAATNFFCFFLLPSKKMITMSSDLSINISKVSSSTFLIAWLSSSSRIQDWISAGSFRLPGKNTFAKIEF